MKNVFKINIDADRIYGLDILRAMAILFVMIEHGNNFLPDHITKYLDLLVLDGVSIFFVLSGFLIGGILIKTIEKQGLSFSSLIIFWVRRWFRTIPGYLLVLVFLTIIELLFRHNFSSAIIARYYIFSQNIFYDHPYWFKEAWSLSVEEWFYISVPLVIFFLGKIKILNGQNTLMLTAIFILFAVTLFRFYRFSHINTTTIIDVTTYWDQSFRKQVATRLDALMYGIIGAYILNFNAVIWKKFKVPFFYAGILILLTQKLFFVSNELTFYNCVLSFLVNALGTLMLLPFLSEYKNGKGFVFNCISSIAMISYAMYLLNLSVVSEIILPQLDKLHLGYAISAILKYSLFWIITILLSIIFYKYYERPAMLLREKVNFIQKRINQ
jgi:peptidoglycan/LPS O-acetylase OafA/YrhL